MIFADRVMGTTTSTGLGDLVVSGVVAGFKPFSEACTIGDSFYYSAVDMESGDFETGIGTYSAANTITRTTVKQSSANNAPIDFRAGTKNVLIDVISDYFANRPEDAPKDGKMYARQNGAWVEVPVSVPEAPNDNTYYTRYNGEWRVIPISGDTDEYDYNAQTAAPPAAGQIRLNGTTHETVTIAWLHRKTAMGYDIRQRLRSLVRADGTVLPDISMYVQDKDDGTKYLTYRLLTFNDQIDTLGYVELGIEHHATGPVQVGTANRVVVVFR